jgi:hypothetical protein
MRTRRWRTCWGCRWPAAFGFRKCLFSDEQRIPAWKFCSLAPDGFVLCYYGLIEQPHSWQSPAQMRVFRYTGSSSKDQRASWCWLARLRRSFTQAHSEAVPGDGPRALRWSSKILGTEGLWWNCVAIRRTSVSFLDSKQELKLY